MKKREERSRRASGCPCGSAPAAARTSAHEQSSEVCSGCEAGSYLRLMPQRARLPSRTLQVEDTSSGQFDSSVHEDTSAIRLRTRIVFFFFFFTLITGPRRSLSLKLGDTSWVIFCSRGTPPRDVMDKNLLSQPTLSLSNSNTLHPLRPFSHPISHTVGFQENFGQNSGRNLDHFEFFTPLQGVTRILILSIAEE